jgi:hypothetical protein
MDLTDVGFTDCSLSALNVHELELTSARITDSRLHHLHIPTVSAAYIELRGVVLENSRLGVPQCIAGSWHSVHIRNAKIGYVSLRGATINDCRRWRRRWPRNGASTSSAERDTGLIRRHAH